MPAQAEKINTIECVIFYVDPKSVTRFPVTNEHSSLVLRGPINFLGINQATAKITFNEIDEKMKIYYINWNCLAFSSDNAFITLGQNDSVFQQIANLAH